MPDAGDPILEMRDIVKTFPGGVVANDEISFSVERGEIHGLLGENGAGKSTLMNVLFGLYNRDSGEIFMNGDPVEIGKPADAIEYGLGMVHQHFMLIPRLTVLENVLLSKAEMTRPETAESPGGVASAVGTGLTSLQQVAEYRAEETRAELTAFMEQYGFDIDPDTTVWDLEVGEKQRVEILKALVQDVDLLILDEPTAVLSPTESEQLFETIEQLSADGLSVILITHKLREITQSTDRVTVLRDGRSIETVDTDSVDKSDLARMMVGREVLFDLEADDVDAGEPVVSVSDLTVENDLGLEALSGVSLSIQEGEILGIAGVSGNGQQELSEALVGIRDPLDGTVTIDGADLTEASTQEFVSRGVSYIPADRHTRGSAPEMSVMHNCMMKDRDQFSEGLGFDYQAGREYAQELVDEFDVKVPDVDVPAGKLSGGNLQRMILARELSRDPAVVVANQPTRGLDVGAIEYIQQCLLDQRGDGTATLLISEDLDEILQMSDRILVLFEGEIVHEVTRENADRDRIGRLMTNGGTARRDSLSDDAAVDSGPGVSTPSPRRSNVGGSE